jgi:hypothetical protein
VRAHETGQETNRDISSPLFGIANCEELCQFLYASRNKPPDTVGQPQRAEICVSNMPSLKAKKLGTFAQEKVLLEL